MLYASSFPSSSLQPDQSVGRCRRRDLLQKVRRLYLPEGGGGLRVQVGRELPQLVPSQVVEGKAAPVDEEAGPLGARCARRRGHRAGHHGAAATTVAAAAAAAAAGAPAALAARCRMECILTLVLSFLFPSSSSSFYPWVGLPRKEGSGTSLAAGAPPHEVMKKEASSLLPSLSTLALVVHTHPTSGRLDSYRRPPPPNKV